MLKERGTPIFAVSIAYLRGMERYSDSAQNVEIANKRMCRDAPREIR